MHELGGAHPGYEGVRAVVLGVTGFMGFWVAHALSRSGADLVCVARDGERARFLLERRGVDADVIARDLAEPGALEEVVGTARPSIVFNLAGYGVDRAEHDDDVAWRINVDLVESLYTSLRDVVDERWCGRHLVHVGSAAEYGANGGMFVETAQTCPFTAYGRTKLEGTKALERLCADGALRAVTARPFTVYGPGEHDGRLLPSLLEAARTGEPLRLTEGNQIRDFTFVGDVVNGLLRLGLDRGARSGEVVNLATGQLLSVRHFVQIAAAVLGIPPGNLKFGALPTRSDEFEHMVVSVTRLRELLGWSPPTSVTEGVSLTARAH